MKTVSWVVFCRKAAHFLGIEFSAVSHSEKWLSGLGGFIAILSIIAISTDFVEGKAAVLVIASMGASSVLAFAVPHGPLSQPWALVGGNVISAIIGVACFKLIPNMLIGAGTAVGLAILAMHYFKCIHPPGGATALLAVIGGQNIHSLGFLYALTPVLLNVSVILIVAIIFNWPYPWRRYPVSLVKHAPPKPAKQAADVFTHGDFEYAMKRLNSFIDVTEEDLSDIYALAREHALRTPLDLEHVKLGAFYSNGLYGDEWAIRQIQKNSSDNLPENILRFRTIAGKERGQEGACTHEEFTQWAQYEVLRIENNWRRLTLQEQANPATATA